MSNNFKEFSYTGEVVEGILSAGLYKLRLWGAQGSSRGSSVGGKGGYIEALWRVTSRTKIFIHVGGRKGWNGGGKASWGGYGGDATDIRRGVDTLENRVIVAAGGGSAGAGRDGLICGHGGGFSGGLPSGGCGTNNGPGGQRSGYALGKGGPGIYKDGGYGGAGGAGYWGGYGTVPDYSADDDMGGSGGSSWADPSLSEIQTFSGIQKMPAPSFEDILLGKTVVGKPGNGFCIIEMLEKSSTFIEGNHVIAPLSKGFA